MDLCPLGNCLLCGGGLSFDWHPYIKGTVHTPSIHNNTILISIPFVHCGHDYRYGTDDAAFYSGNALDFDTCNTL